MSSKNLRSESFKKHPSSFSRQLSLPASTEGSNKTNTPTGGLRDADSVMNTSSLLEDPEPEALTIDASNYDEGEHYQLLILVLKYYIRRVKY